jgi:hypothetical protein
VVTREAGATENIAARENRDRERNWILVLRRSRLGSLRMQSELDRAPWLPDFAHDD